MDYADVRHEGEPYSGYGFSVPAEFPDVDTVLTHYDPAVRTYYGYDSIPTNVSAFANDANYVSTTALQRHH